jgi:hypothetical protein
MRTTTHHAPRIPGGGARTKEGVQVIGQKSYDAFWEWFGKAVQKLRYQRHICPLWQTGYTHHRHHRRRRRHVVGPANGYLCVVFTWAASSTDS